MIDSSHVYVSTSGRGNNAAKQPITKFEFGRNRWEQDEDVTNATTTATTIHKYTTKYIKQIHKNVDGHYGDGNGHINT